MTPRSVTPSTKRAPQRRLVTLAIAAVLAVAALLAHRRHIVIPAAWAALGVVWLAVRCAVFETARPAVVPVRRWRSDADLASPSLDVAPSDHLAWPVVALPGPGGSAREVAAPFGYYLHEFRHKDDPDAALPDTLPVRYHSTPLGSVVLADDRAHVLTGPALFIAAMLLLWSLWGTFDQLLAVLTR